MRGDKLSTLVIGGAGYIGAHLVPMLLSTGRQVTVLGRKAKPIHELPEAATYVEGDFGQSDLLQRLLDRHQEVIHLAYATAPNTSFENPLVDLSQNLPPAVQLFSEAADRGLSNMEVIKAIAPLLEEIGHEVKVDHLPERTFDVKANVLDSTKLQAHTVWKPKVEFNDGLRRTCEWLRNYHD